MLTKMHPEEAARLMGRAQEETLARWRLYEQLAGLDYRKAGN